MSTHMETIDTNALIGYVKGVDNSIDDEFVRFFIATLFKPSTEFCILLNDVFDKYLGIDTVGHAKRLLYVIPGEFVEDKDYKIDRRTLCDNESPKDETLLAAVGKNLGGRPTDSIWLTIPTFKRLCVKINSDQGKLVRDWYVLLEDCFKAFFARKLGLSFDNPVHREALRTYMKANLKEVGDKFINRFVETVHMSSDTICFALEDVYQDLGFSTIKHAKESVMLESNAFVYGKDYAITAEHKKTKGQPKKHITISLKIYAHLSMRATTKRGRDACRYYVAFDDLFKRYILTPGAKAAPLAIEAPKDKPQDINDFTDEPCIYLYHIHDHIYKYGMSTEVDVRNNTHVNNFANKGHNIKLLRWWKCDSEKAMRETENCIKLYAKANNLASDAFPPQKEIIEHDDGKKLMRIISKYVRANNEKYVGCIEICKLKINLALAKVNLAISREETKRENIRLQIKMLELQNNNTQVKEIAFDVPPAVEPTIAADDKEEVPAPPDAVNPTAEWINNNPANNALKTGYYGLYVDYMTARGDKVVKRVFTEEMNKIYRSVKINNIHAWRRRE